MKSEVRVKNLEEKEQLDLILQMPLFLFLFQRVSRIFCVLNFQSAENCNFLLVHFK